MAGGRGKSRLDIILVQNIALSKELKIYQVTDSGRAVLQAVA